MSFEKSHMVRFAATKNAGRTQIFWEQENMKKPKKKTNYKSREQSYPLRSRIEQQEAVVVEPEAPVHKAAPAPKPPKKPAVVKQRKPPGFTNRPKNDKSKEANAKPEGAVTLTREELATILTSLGKVSKDHPLRISIDSLMTKDKDTNSITIEEEEKAKLEKKKKKKKKGKEDSDEGESEVENKPKKKAGKKKETENQSIFNLLGAVKDDDDNDDDVDSAIDDTGADDGDDEVDDEEEEVEKVQKKSKKKKKHVEEESDDEEGDEEEEEKEKEKKGRKKNKSKKADDTEEDVEEKETKKKKKKGKKSKEENELEIEEVDPSTPRSQSKPEELKSPMYLTISEKKRLQWQKERAEQRADFNPWGRPGAGAPIKDSAGDVLADFNTRKEDEPDQGARPRKAQQQVVDEQMNFVSPRGMSQAKTTHRSSPQTTTLTTSPYVDQSKLPAAMRSSFAFGGTYGDNAPVMTTKELEKKKWLEDLERQIEEKQMQKLGMKAKDTEVAETWADRMETKRKEEDAVIRASTAPEEKAADGDVAFPGQISTFIRGQNALIDPATMQDLAEKRRRHLEHQQAIQEQVEERQRLKREERERKIAEELEEERKLQAERDKLQQQFETEQMKQKRKEFDQNVRLQKLKEAMDQAHQEAMAEKHLKRMQHLKEHGHDISQLHKSFEAKYTPRAPTTVPDSTFVPGLDITPRQNEVFIETERVVTPTKLRQNTEPALFSDRKEFGVQTDPGLANGGTVEDTTHNRDNSAGIQYRGHVVEQPVGNRVSKGREKKVRLRSANTAPAPKEKRVPQASVPPRPLKPGQKPRWNQPAPSVRKAKPLKQSEKDPMYQRRRKEAEERRLKREQKLFAMQEANMNRIPASERGRSRSPSGNRYGDFERQRRDPSPEPELIISAVTPHGQRRSRVDGQRSRMKSHSPENRASILRTRVSRSPPTHRGNAGTPSTSVHVGSVRARSKSPPVPAVRNRLHSEQQGADDNSPKHFDTLGDHRGHYSDLRPSHAPVDNGDFVPFLRSSAFLDPAESQMPLPVSREMTRVEQGRKAYAQGLKPGDYGSKMENIQDTGLDKVLPGKKPLKDPILNPSLVKDHPTSRQEMILQQLSDIRKNLLQRQREIETCLQPSDVTAASNTRSGME